MHLAFSHNENQLSPRLSPDLIGGGGMSRRQDGNGVDLCDPGVFARDIIL